MNRFTELLAVFENAESNRSIEISGRRRDTVIEALRAAGVANEHPAISVMVPISLTVERLADLMVTFVESGVSQEWCNNMTTTPELRARYAKKDWPWYAAPALYSDPAFTLTLNVDKATESDTGLRVLTLHDLAKGLVLLATKADGAYGRHFIDIMQENEDAATADIFMQMVVYGDEVFS